VPSFITHNVNHLNTVANGNAKKIENTVTVKLINCISDKLLLSRKFSKNTIMKFTPTVHVVCRIKYLMAKEKLIQVTLPLNVAAFPTAKHCGI